MPDMVVSFYANGDNDCESSDWISNWVPKNGGDDRYFDNDGVDYRSIGFEANPNGPYGGGGAHCKNGAFGSKMDLGKAELWLIKRLGMKLPLKLK
ncbi:MAG: hypothetical protein Q9160_004660 [Pyrenula sp. 1 TL-2023]